jgi:hypothetical protein
MELKSIGVLSSAKVGAIFGLLWGVVMAVVIMSYGSSIGLLSGFAVEGFAVGGLGAVLALAVGLVGGFVGGAIIAFLYNLIAKSIGGIELNLK